MCLQRWLGKCVISIVTFRIKDTCNVHAHEWIPLTASRCRYSQNDWHFWLTGWHLRNWLLICAVYFWHACHTCIAPRLCTLKCFRHICICMCIMCNSVHFGPRVVQLNITVTAVLTATTMQTAHRTTRARLQVVVVVVTLDTRLFHLCIPSL